MITDHQINTNTHVFLFGALIVGVFSSGLSIAGLDVLWQRFALGCLIIIAVGIDQWIRKVSN